MKKYIIQFLSVAVFLLLGVQCTFIKEKLGFLDKDAYYMDLEDIQARGNLRVAVDNNSTSYYIYRGRRMGYEYELLRDLGERYKFQIEYVVVSDIESAFDMLEEGKVDIIAMNLEMTEERKERVDFSNPIGNLSTVIVGLKPVEKPVTWEEIGTDTVVVRKGTVYESQLLHLKDSLKLGFTVVESSDHEETLIDQVAEGKLRWTVADQNIAQANATYYEDLDATLRVSEVSSVAWGLRKNSPKLLEALDSWLVDKKKKLIPDLYSKYFVNSRNNFYRTNSPYSSLSGNKISVYDELIKEGAGDLGWDWRLLAALVYKESGFDTTAVSYAGAEGLLQLMPVTLERFGVTNPNDPAQSLKGGVKYLQYLDKFWRERVPDSMERISFILASYNIGQGHVEDAWRLTMKYGKNTKSWKEVSFYLNRKSDPEYFRDPLVKSGYAKGHIAVNYVRDVMGLYDSYKQLIDP